MTKEKGILMRKKLLILVPLCLLAAAVWAAAAGDAKRFTKANGVGAKLAQRIVLELKDKVKGLSFAGTDLSGIEPGGPSAAGNAAQAAEALVTLGYSPSEAAAAVGRLDSSLPAEELIRLALKGFGSR